jgi:hypothetical protein
MKNIHAQASGARISPASGCDFVVMDDFRVKGAAAAAFAAALALAGCFGRDSQDFLAQASDSAVRAARAKNHEALDQRIAYHAKLNGVPESLVHAVVHRESKYDPSLRHGPYWGLMQIRHDTARSMGYSGPPIGLLDPETNLTYAVAYLANAYRVAGGDQKRAQRLYMRGFYLEAKRRGRLGLLHPAPSPEPTDKAEDQTSTEAQAQTEAPAAAADIPAAAETAETRETAAR